MVDHHDRGISRVKVMEPGVSGLPLQWRVSRYSDGFRGNLGLMYNLLLQLDQLYFFV
jgi:hypothetical protein